MHKEKHQPPTDEVGPTTTLANALLALKDGECLRLTTATEMYLMSGVRQRTTAKLPKGKRVVSRMDGNDVLFFIVDERLHQ
jgi:hypothetical protein